MDKSDYTTEFFGEVGCILPMGCVDDFYRDSHGYYEFIQESVICAIVPPMIVEVDGEDEDSMPYNYISNTPIGLAVFKDLTWSWVDLLTGNRTDVRPSLGGDYIEATTEFFDYFEPILKDPKKLMTFVGTEEYEPFRELLPELILAYQKKAPGV